MENPSASTVVRWIARIWGGLTGLGIAAMFLGYLGADLYNLLRGTPLDPDGFLAGGTAAFFAQVLPTFVMVGLSVAGFVLFWSRERLGIWFALTGALFTWLFASVMALVSRAGMPDASAGARIFGEMLPLPALLALPALLMLLARRLERPAQKSGA